MSAEQLRAELLDVLTNATEPLSTTQARLAVTERCQRRGRPVVAEEVYRALVILARRGLVRRVTDQPGRRAHWELTCRHVRPRMSAPRLNENIESFRRTSDLQPPS
ncbi:MULTISPECIES: hypothetical protein [unclassified Mycobacterium]|uniref:hypothetical protein n=1 Tax=unclassified Mycobacterium TaxID=2642494 RepID=UPI0012E92307|nr:MULTISPECIES: hypothetical protein [unclassified Mycobacterium]